MVMTTDILSCMTAGRFASAVQTAYLARVDITPAQRRALAAVAEDGMAVVLPASMPAMVPVVVVRRMYGVQH